MITLTASASTTNYYRKSKHSPGLLPQRKPQGPMSKESPATSIHPSTHSNGQENIHEHSMPPNWNGCLLRHSLHNLEKVMSMESILWPKTPIRCKDLLVDLAMEL